MMGESRFQRSNGRWQTKYIFWKSCIYEDHGWKFTENDIKLDAGSWLQWRNMDDEALFTLAEANGKLTNISVRSRTYFYFNTTGTYKFDLYYPR